LVKIKLLDNERSYQRVLIKPLKLNSLSKSM
jgi:hypothetical protein